MIFKKYSLYLGLLFCSISFIATSVNATCFATTAATLSAAVFIAATNVANIEGTNQNTENADLLSQSQRLLQTLHYNVGGVEQYPDGEVLTIVNLDTFPDDLLAMELEDGIGQQFDGVDREFGEDPRVAGNESLPEHRLNRQMSLIYQGVYVPDARFNAFVDGVMVNMVAEMRRRRMDPLYFKVHKGGAVQHVPTRRRTGKGGTEEKGADTRQAIGGGVIRGLTKVKRFGNAEVQVAGNDTLVRSHHVFGPLDFEFVFETAKGVRTINSTLTSLASHGLARVSSSDPSSFLDFIIDSPSDYEMQLRGAIRNKRLRRLSKAAIVRLVRREGRLETRLMRMFGRAGERRLPAFANRKSNGTDNLWYTAGVGSTQPPTVTLSPGL